MINKTTPLEEVDTIKLSSISDQKLFPDLLAQSVTASTVVLNSASRKEGNRVGDKNTSQVLADDKVTRTTIKATTFTNSVDCLADEQVSSSTPASPSPGGEQPRQQQQQQHQQFISSPDLQSSQSKAIEVKITTTDDSIASLPTHLVSSSPHSNPTLGEFLNYLNWQSWRLFVLPRSEWDVNTKSVTVVSVPVAHVQYHHCHVFFSFVLLLFWSWTRREWCHLYIMHQTSRTSMFSLDEPTLCKSTLMLMIHSNVMAQVEEEIMVVVMIITLEDIILKLVMQYSHAKW